jgi:hypothetical protein
VVIALASYRITHCNDHATDRGSNTRHRILYDSGLLILSLIDTGIPYPHP